MKHHSTAIGILLGLGMLLYLLSPFGRSLWIPDEPRYAEVAMAMADTGNWIIPHLNKELYAEKPPLFFWQLAISAKIFGGWHSFAMIAPAAFAAIGCILMTYALATMLFNRHIALLSALVLMTMLLFTGVGQMVRMDMFLILCFLVSFFSFYKIYTHRQANTFGYALLFYAAAGLGTLTKGPIGLGLPGLIITMFVVWKFLIRRESPFDFDLFRKMHVIPGTLVYVAIILAWFIPAIRQQGWEYAYLITIRQNLGRVVDSFSHPRPWYFYLYTLPWITLPWFPFLVSAALKHRSDSVPKPEQDALTFLWIWVATTFLFFTAVSGKLQIYLLPLFPAAAILIGRLWWQVLSRRQAMPAWLRYLTYPTFFLGGVLTLGGIVMLFIPETRQYPGGVGILTSLGILMLILAARRMVRALFGVIWSFTPVLLLYGILVVVPVIEPEFTLSQVIRDLDRWGALDQQLGVWHNYFPINYFLPGHAAELETLEEKREFFASKDPVYCLVRQPHLDYVEDELGKPVYVLANYRIDNTDFVLVSQYPLKKPALQE